MIMIIGGQPRPAHDRRHPHLLPPGAPAIFHIGVWLQFHQLYFQKALHCFVFKQYIARLALLYLSTRCKRLAQFGYSRRILAEPQLSGIWLQFHQL